MSFFSQPLGDELPIISAITEAYRRDEAQCVSTLLSSLESVYAVSDEIRKQAKQFVSSVREQESDKGGIEALMQHYDLSTKEGIVLMCLAEALLRVPDKETEDLLIKDKLTSANWSHHLGASESSFVNLATWGLALTGKVLKHNDKPGSFKSIWEGMIQRSGEPVIRQAIRAAIKVMSEHFVLGRNIKEALKRSEPLMKKGYAFSYDMLGEVARTQADADRYYEAYQSAIIDLGRAEHDTNEFHGPSISVKLSALYPRYEFAQQEAAVEVLTKRLKQLCLLAIRSKMSLTVDAEEADRLMLSLSIIEKVFSDPALGEWKGFGIALQAYQKRAFHVIPWLIDLATKHDRVMQVRLVKGAYWDTEIKLSQVGGYSDYPVFTRKATTDVSYLACAKRLLEANHLIYPKFATHNAHTVASILHMVSEIPAAKFEFQKLQGMGTSLHDQIVEKGIPCRVYAPVGSHEDLLPYLVRRLLENGANSSFVNRISDPDINIDDIIQDPIATVRQLDVIKNPNIPLPSGIYGLSRQNSHGVDFTHHQQAKMLEIGMLRYQSYQWSSAPFSQEVAANEKFEINNPANLSDVVGHCQFATLSDVEQALATGESAYETWHRVSVDDRADCLDRIALLIEKHQAELMMLLQREAGKTLPDAMAEIREAVDFCRYYAVEARRIMAPQVMSGPTGESNILALHGRGCVLCISPWNFPLAIFTGQIVAALVTGNTVISKPAEQTPLIAARAVSLFHEAGIPQSVCQLLPGPGESIGKALVEDARIAGVLFTGSNQTAKHIQLSLAKKSGPIVPFIAETGGINAMIVDSTALPEQLIADVIASAFGSAGQRCSALRLLILQKDIAEDVMTMLKGAMACQRVGDPRRLKTDIGPVIDEAAKDMLEAHIEKMRDSAKILCQIELPASCGDGMFVSPTAIELHDIAQLQREVFGPVLHIVTYEKKQLDQVIDQINGLGYGLTFGIHSRIEQTANQIAEKIKVGNVYINRNMIGAVVGVQPFGGSRLSGTGPKAGGPYYLYRLCEEKTISVDTTAAGGNASLMSESSETN